MDAEACLRGTTVYLVDKRIDMLPDRLSSNLCSLRGGEERFAFSVLWELTPDGDVISQEFTKSIILSRAALTYQRAHEIILDKSDQVWPLPPFLLTFCKRDRCSRPLRKGSGA